MADGDKHQGGGGGANNGLILVALVAVGGYFIVHQAPLNTSRPPTMEPAFYEKSGNQDIVSRLWQDPFGAVAPSAAATKTECSPSSPKTGDARHCRSPLLDASGNSLAKDALVIGVMVPGGPYSDIAEMRRRLRYAVTSALHAERFEPEDAQHIGYFRPEAKPKAPEAKPKVDASLPLPEFVPYEWFKRELSDVISQPYKTDKILILWLNEDVLTGTKRPYSQLSTLINFVRRSNAPKCQS